MGPKNASWVQKIEFEILRNGYHHSIPHPRIPSVNPYEFQGWAPKTPPGSRKLSLKFWETNITNEFQNLAFPAIVLQKALMLLFVSNVPLTYANKPTDRHTHTHTQTFFSLYPPYSRGNNLDAIRRNRYGGKWQLTK